MKKTRIALIVMMALMGLIAINGCKKSSTPVINGPQNLNTEFGTVTDIDGNVYRTVRIGDQWWMAENLRVTRDPKGNPIESFCYNDDEGMAQTYGRLYSWDAAMNGSTTEGAQGIAPDGWRIPSESDWDKLIETLGGTREAGGHLKETGTALWNEPNEGATNLSGFSAIASGEIDRGVHRLLGTTAVFWTSKEIGADNALYVHVHHDDTIATKQRFFKSVMFYSIRCIKN